MTDLTTALESPNTGPTEAQIAKPVGTATGRYAALQPAQVAFPAPAPIKDSQPAQKQTQGAGGVEGGKRLQSTASGKQESQQIFLAGDTQVTVMSAKMSDMPEVSDILSDTLAGASPHAPDPPRRERRKNRNSKGYKFSFRMPEAIKAKLDAKAFTLESYPSAYVLELVAADLNLPLDEFRVHRNSELKLAYANLRRAFDDCGVNLNQMAKATNAGMPCPLTRKEIDEALKKFKNGCAAIEGLRPS